MRPADLSWILNFRQIVFQKKQKNLENGFVSVGTFKDP